MSEREIKLSIMDKADTISKLLVKGKHIEIHNSNNGIKVYIVDKKIAK